MHNNVFIDIVYAYLVKIKDIYAVLKIRDIYAVLYRSVIISGWRNFYDSKSVW